jgi:hypothetical protein
MSDGFTVIGKKNKTFKPKKERTLSFFPIEYGKFSASLGNLRYETIFVAQEEEDDNKKLLHRLISLLYGKGDGEEISSFYVNKYFAHKDTARPCSRDMANTFIVLSAYTLDYMFSGKHGKEIADIVHYCLKDNIKICFIATEATDEWDTETLLRFNVHGEHSKTV